MNFVEGIIYMIWRGLAIGVIISAPMGPVGILCVQRTLEKGRRTGLFTGIGAAISDMIYCLLTGFGLSFIEEFLERNQNVIQLFGSVVLIAFGVYLFRSNPSRKIRKPEEKNVSARKNILNGFLFTFSNPLIIFLIIGLFARFNFMMPNIRSYHYVVGFLSIGAGALLWWWIVTYFVDKVRAHFNLRSMWLINKIIGVIILIFALVGIITAITAMANAQTPSHYSLNSRRGFGELAEPERNDCSPLLIKDTTEFPIFRMMPIGKASSFNVEMRVANINNESGKKYRYVDSEGKRKTSLNPMWGFCLKDVDGHRKIFTLKTEDPRHESLYRNPCVKISLTDPDNEKERDIPALYKEVSSGFDLFSGPNSFLINYDNGRIIFQGGNREYRPLIETATALGKIDSIGVVVMPGGALRVDYLNLELPSPAFSAETTRFGNPDILETYLLRSSDKMEGIWRTFDRTLDEEYLRQGGDYRLAAVKADDGYDLIYIDGAVTMADRWRPGMIKAKLRPSGFTDIYNVEWFDATGAPIKNEIKAQYVAPLLTFTFPYQQSTLRMRKEISK